MSRTSSILSRVRLNLNAVSIRDIKDTTIYKQMQEAQRQIILDSRSIELELPITTVADQAEYNLIYTNIDDEPDTTRDCIGEIIEIITPSTYSIKIDLIPNDGWNEVVNEDYFIDSISESQQPLFATIFGRQIIFHPAPAAAGEIIKLWVYQTDSLEDISASVEPEVQPYFDRAIEFYATAMLNDEKFNKYMALYEREMEKHSGRPSLKHTKGMTHNCEW